MTKATSRNAAAGSEATSRNSGSALDFPRPLVMVDVVIFTVLQASLHVLLVQRPDDLADPAPGRWALPGGFIDVGQDRDLQGCAQRKLREKTGVRTPYLEQLASWGSRDRDPRGWCVTTAYFALVPADACSLRGQESAGPGSSLVPVRWVECGAAMKLRLAFDHREIVQAAIDRLRSKSEYTSLPAFLLTEPFTLPQLQDVFEIVLQRKQNEASFRRRMLDAGFLAEDAPVVISRVRKAQGWRLADRSRPAVFPRTFKAAE